MYKICEPNFFSLFFCALHRKINMGARRHANQTRLVLNGTQTKKIELFSVAHHMWFGVIHGKFYVLPVIVK